MKLPLKYSAFVIILLFLLVDNSLAQDANYVLAYGKFKIEWGNTDNTLITLFEDNKKIDDFIPERNGKFQFSLELNHLYMFKFEKLGYVTKKVQFDTHIPEAATSNPDFIPFPDFDFYVTLFESYPDVDTMFFENPVGKIQYDASINDFDWDKDYTLKIQRSLEKIEKDIREKHEKKLKDKDENEKLAKQKAIEEDKTRKEKERLLKQNTIDKEKAKKEDEYQAELLFKQQQNEANRQAEIEKEKQETDAQKLADKQAEKEKLVETIPTESIEPNKTAKQVEKKDVVEPKETEIIIYKPNTAYKTTKVDKVEVTGKKTTRTTITEDGITLIYIKVEHSWGAVFYFIQDDDNEYINISQSYYNIMISKK